MKLKYILLSLLIVLILLTSIDMYVEKNTLNKEYVLKELKANSKEIKDQGDKKKYTISSIVKSISKFDDVDIINIQLKDNENINIEIKYNDINNLRVKVQSIEKIPGFKSIDRIQIESLENTKYVAILSINFVK